MKYPARPQNPVRKIPLLERALERNLLKNGETYDKTLVQVLLCLLCFGLVMVYSASAAQAGLADFDRRFFFLAKQAQFALLGLAASFLLMRVPMWRWQRWTPYLLVITLGTLVVLPWMGEEVNGARRWLNTPLGVKVQPAEMFKLVTVMYMASFFKRRVDILHDFRRVLWVGVPVAFGAALVLLTRDLGSMMVVAGIFLCLLFLANMPMKWFAGAVSVSLATIVLIIATSEFRMKRIAVMWQPWKDPTGTGYQGLGSLLSMSQGGLLVCVYVWIIWRAFSIGKQARDLDLHFNSFIAVGVGVWVAAQSFINIGVNISLLPNKGLTLPLVSYGGSSLVIMLAAFTMLLRVDYENRRKMRGYCVLDPKESARAQQQNKEQPENE